MHQKVTLFNTYEEENQPYQDSIDQKQAKRRPYNSVCFEGTSPLQKTAIIVPEIKTNTLNQT